MHDDLAVRHAARITFATADGTTHAPLVEAVVNGVRTRLVLDTGATDHLLTLDVCEAANLATEPGEPGTDSTGSSVPSWQARDVTIAIGALELALPEIIAIDAPALRRAGLGGTLSPQRLRPNTYVALDLTEGGAATMLRADHLDGWLATSYPGRRALQLPAVEGDGTVLVEAAIDDFPPVVTMLDTGAKMTYAAGAAVPGMSEGRQRRSTGHGVGGTESFGVDVPGRVLHVGGAQLAVDLVVAEHDLGIPRCVVGMDLLRGSVLAVGPPGSPVRWLVP